MPKRGDNVRITYMDTRKGGVAVAEGTLDGILGKDGKLRELAVAGDGCATFIPVGWVVRVEKI